MLQRPSLLAVLNSSKFLFTSCKQHFFAIMALSRTHQRLFQQPARIESDYTIFWVIF